METRCEKCGAPVGAEQAFCPRCGAVVGMGGTAPDGEGWDLPDTILGRKPPAAPRPSAERPPAPVPAEAAGHVRAEAAQPVRADAVGTQQPRAGGKTLLLAVVVFVAVLLVGGLLVMLYLNSEA